MAEAKCGELFNSLPKIQGSRTDLQPLPAAGNKFKNEQKPKLEIAKELGFNKNQVSQFQKLADNPALVQKTIADAKDNGDIPTRSAVLDKIKKVHKQEKSNERIERKKFELADNLPPDMCKLFQADIRDGLPQIADNSVDFIITDPPYPKEYLPLYSDLSKIAARILKNGGSLVCMVGQSYLPDVINQLAKFMSYHWCMCYLTPGGQSPQLFQKKVNSFWKPVLWFVKGEYNGDWAGDVLKSSVNDNDKNFHEWGQSNRKIFSIFIKFFRKEN